jgi:tetratricopeptide (TPR) repeat protein
MKLLMLSVMGLLLVPALAYAEPKTADDWYKEGANQYNLGDFDKAVDAFKKGFELETNDSKKPAYLYNIAQAYRQAHRCSDAEFFYKRYLSLKDQDTAKPLEASKRAEVEGWIAEEEKCAQNEGALAQKRPDSTMKPDGGTPTTTTPPTTTKPTTTTPPTATKPTTTVATKTGDDSSGDDDDSNAKTTKSTHVGAAETTEPELISIRLTGGVDVIKAGGLSVPIQGTFNLFAGYPLSVGNGLRLEVGVDAAYTPVPFTNLMTAAKETASLISALADAGLNYDVAPNIGLRADFGIGVLAFTGMGDPGNPFTNNGAATTGALGMLAVRGAVAADYAFTPNLVATVTPFAIEYSPAKSGLRDDISSIINLDFMVGLGYRM